MSRFITGRPRVASVFLNRVKSSAAQVCGGPGAAAATLAVSFLALCFYWFLRGFDWFSRYNGLLSVAVVGFTR